MYGLLVILNLIWGSYATIFIDGPCPKITPVKNLNLTALTQGKWFEVARYPNDWEKKDDCSYIEFNNVSGTIRFKVGGTYKKISESVDGVLDFAPNANGQGILLFKSSSFEGQVDKDKLPVYILDIDYDKYIIGYECKYDEATKKRHDFAWVDSRTVPMDNKVKKIVNDFVKSSNLINWNFLVWNHFTADFCNLKS